jgi:hypothetical protein
MGSSTDRKKDPNEATFTIVKIRGRHIKIATDAQQPGADARKAQGTRVLQSIFDAAREMKRRDADRE